MVTETEHTLATEAFDREYGLTDLLDPKRLAVVFRQVEAGGLLRLVICHPDGKPYFPKGAPASSSSTDELPQGATLPLRHELETVGILQVRGAADLAPEARRSVAGFARAVLEGLMMERYRYLMSARLHGEVVEDSYLRLQQKAEALAKSEARYKGLAARLEKEVARQAEEIRETQARLMERAQLAAIGQLAAGMAHEINNPMGFISSNLNTLEQYTRELAPLLTDARRFWRFIEGCPAPLEGRDDVGRQAAALEEAACRIDLDYLLVDLPELLRESREGSERIRTIVANLKSFAQPGIETRTTLDLNRCLEATLQVLSPNMAGRVTAACRLADALPEVLGSESQLNQAFMNVILNAVQASPAGGEIRLHTVRSGDAVEVQIADDGPGIPEAHHNRVFEPFYTTREVGDGCGLGLTLTYNTIQQHGGTIRIQNPPAGGTTVVIRLPIDGGR